MREAAERRSVGPAWRSWQQQKQSGCGSDGNDQLSQGARRTLGARRAMAEPGKRRLQLRRGRQQQSGFVAWGVAMQQRAGIEGF